MLKTKEKVEKIWWKECVWSKVKEKETKRKIVEIQDRKI